MLSTFFQLIGRGPQDIYITETPLWYIYKFDSLDWGELRHLPRAERVAHLHADWQALVATDKEQRYLVWAARHSPESALYALPLVDACSVVDHLRTAQAKRMKKAKKRYEKANSLLELIGDAQDDPQVNAAAV
jgi:hypothetical protein